MSGSKSLEAICCSCGSVLDAILSYVDLEAAIRGDGGGGVGKDRAIVADM